VTAHGGPGGEGRPTSQDGPTSGGLDLIGGRLLDPGQQIDRAATISVDGGLISGIREPADTQVAGREQIDVTGMLVTPGLIDLHTHLYPGVSHYGVEPDPHCLGRGVTTAVDAGSAGAQTFPGLRRYVIERCSTQIFAFLNIAVEGMITNLVGELEDIRWASPEQAVARAREHSDLVMGIKVRLGYQMVGDDPGPALRLALQAADELGLPLMVHVIDMRPGLAWLLPRLRRGDVVTHCFHGNEGGILGGDGRVLSEAIAARERGVLFDIGPGIGSFAYRVARNAVAQGFAPDTISSDLHAHNAGGPVFDQATTLSKLLHVGMELDDVIKATACTPAGAIGKAASIGAIAAGREADLSVFELRTGHWALPDAAGQTEVIERLLVPRAAVRAGRIHAIEPAAAGLIAAERDR
jgi:dihydroorotase